MSVSSRGSCVFAFLVGFSTIGCTQNLPVPVVRFPPKAPGRYHERLYVGGLNRTYILRVPQEYDGSRPLPLVVVLHGLSGSADGADANTGMGDEASKEGFILVAPEGTGDQPLHGWNAGFFNMTGVDVNDVQFIESLINKIQSEVGVDEDRIYVAGHSNGAFLAHLLGSGLSKRIAAIAAVSGTIGVPDRDGGMKIIPKPTEPVSALIIHGKQDPMVQYDSRSPALLHDVGAMDSARFWARNDGCSMTPRETRSPDGNIITDTFSGGRNGTEVTLVSIVNGTHDWPGGYSRSGWETRSGIRAASLIWEFFKSHPKRRS